MSLRFIDPTEMNPFFLPVIPGTFAGIPFSKFRAFLLPCPPHRAPRSYEDVFFAARSLVNQPCPLRVPCGFLLDIYCVLSMNVEVNAPLQCSPPPHEQTFPNHFLLLFPEVLTLRCRLRTPCFHADASLPVGRNFTQVFF